MINFVLLVNTVSLMFAALNLVMLLAILMTITSVADAPRAWMLLTLGLSLVVIHFSLNVFVWTNPPVNMEGLRILSAGISLAGFFSLFVGISDVWKVIQGG